MGRFRFRPARGRLWAPLSALALLFGARTALADKVAVLPFISVGNATSAQLADARASTRAAVLALSDTLPTDSEMLTAEMSAKDGVADTSDEYRAAGRASSSDWTVLGHVDEHGGTYRLEVDACQVASGRVESLAREIDPAQAAPQIKEMLAILLRPSGIDNAEIPWERTGPPPPAPPPLPITPPAPAPAPASAPAPAPAPAPPAAEPEHRYAEGNPLAVGVGLSGFGALHRSSMAVGSSASMLLSGTVAYALEGAPGVELRGNVAGSLAGPGSVSFDLGARYAVPVVPSIRLFAGPEADLGAFFTTGGDKTGRFLLHGAGFLALGIGDRVQIEAAVDLEYAAGGSSALFLGGGTVRGLARF